MRKLALALLIILLAVPSFAADLGINRGIAVVLGDSSGEVATDLASDTDLVIYSSPTTGREVAKASKALDAAGLFGKRVFVGKDAPGAIGLASNVADLVYSASAPATGDEEILRVLRPGGVASVGDREMVKETPEGLDDWSHHYHGPDNNPQSLDTVARAPYLTQFVADPRYGPAPQASVASGGRIFMAFGHVAWHEREEPVLNTLIAMNGYNGTELWRRPLTEGIMVDRSTMIATPDTLYLGDRDSCKLIDARTGETTDEIVAPEDIAEGPFWKWMALQDDVLYALVGRDEPADDTAMWRAVRHGWPWGGISKGYNENEYTWGLGRTLFAMDPETKRVLWHLDEEETIDARTLCMKGDRIYYATFGRFITCVDARSGDTLWRRTIMDDPDIFDAIGPYRPGHGYIGGWKSTVYLKCTDDALYVVGPQVEWLTALSAEDGSVMWKHAVKDLHIVIRDDGLYIIGAQGQQGQTKKLDLVTGAVLASFDFHRRACTRSVGSVDGVLFRASGGSVRLDEATGRPQWISPMRPSCHIGVVIANGHLYWVPWACDCNLQMFGVIALGPAGDFEFGQEASADRLTTLSRGHGPAPLQIHRNDWPTYRADNKRSARTGAKVALSPSLLWEIDSGTTPTAPTAAGGLAFFAGADGIVRAVDAGSGKPKWQAFTGGGVTYPPSISDGRAFVGSGDGCAYALDATSGKTLYSFQAAPANRRIPFYGGLINTWPVGSGVLVDSGTAYFASGIMDFDGTQVYALDAASGDIKWQNTTSGHLDESSKRGVACQGELLLNEGSLFLAGGNAMSPGVFDAATGECRNQPPKFVGTTAPRGRELSVSGRGVRVSGQPLYSTDDSPVFDGSVATPDPVVKVRGAELIFRGAQSGDDVAWGLVCRTRDDADIWELPLPGEPVRWGIAVDAEGRIIVTMKSGQVACFG